jgi:hypothetical protein
LDEIGVSLKMPCVWKGIKGTARTAKKLLKLQPHKAIGVHSLHSYDSIARPDFCNCYLQLLGIFKIKGH